MTSMSIFKILRCWWTGLTAMRASTCLRYRRLLLSRHDLLSLPPPRYKSSVYSLSFLSAQTLHTRLQCLNHQIFLSIYARLILLCTHCSSHRRFSLLLAVRRSRSATKSDHRSARQHARRSANKVHWNVNVFIFNAGRYLAHLPTPRSPTWIPGASPILVSPTRTSRRGFILGGILLWVVYVSEWHRKD